MARLQCSSASCVSWDSHRSSPSSMTATCATVQLRPPTMRYSTGASKTGVGILSQLERFRQVSHQTGMSHATHAVIGASRAAIHPLLSGMSEDDERPGNIQTYLSEVYARGVATLGEGEGRTDTPRRRGRWMGIAGFLCLLRSRLVHYCESRRVGWGLVKH